MLDKSALPAESRSTSGTTNWAEAGGAGVSICLLTACLVLFNFFPEKVGYFRTIVDPASFVPLLAPGFAVFLPALDLWWGLALAVEFRRMARGHLTTGTIWARIGLDLIGAAILAGLALARPFADVPAGLIIAHFALPIASFALLAGALVKAAGQVRAAAGEGKRYDAE